MAQQCWTKKYVAGRFWYEFSSIPKLERKLLWQFVLLVGIIPGGKYNGKDPVGAARKLADKQAYYFGTGNWYTAYLCNGIWPKQVWVPCGVFVGVATCSIRCVIGRIHYGLKIVFCFIHFTASHYHHDARLLTGVEHMQIPIEFILWRCA